MGHLGGVDDGAGGSGEVEGAVVVSSDGVIMVVDLVMVVTADRPEVPEIRWSAIKPVPEMMDLAPIEGCVAEHAAAVQFL